jgi:hypothetical protein
MAHSRTAVPEVAAELGSSMQTVATAFRGRSRCCASTSQRWLSLLPQVARRTGQLLAVQLSAAKHRLGLLLTTRIWLSNVQRWLTAARAPAMHPVSRQLYGGYVHGAPATVSSVCQLPLQGCISMSCTPRGRPGGWGCLNACSGSHLAKDPSPPALQAITTMLAPTTRAPPVTSRHSVE